MTRMVWNAPGKRYIEAGVDRGVLYVGSAPGVPWGGLVAVNESSSGVNNKANYIDGVKYSNRLSTEEFEATIEAYTYPDEFAKCDGTASVGNGLFATQQRRLPFSFAYRTKIGNDIDGMDHAYKIHIVYDAIAEPSGNQHKTLSDSTDSSNFSWKISTKPSKVVGIRPTSHLVIDSRTAPSALLGSIEDILYGTNANQSRLPSAGELAYLFTSFNNTNFDAGGPLDVSFYTYDSGTPSSVNTNVLDGGTP